MSRTKASGADSDLAKRVEILETKMLAVQAYLERELLEHLAYDRLCVEHQLPRPNGKAFHNFNALFAIISGQVPLPSGIEAMRARFSPTITSWHNLRQTELGLWIFDGAAQ